MNRLKILLILSTVYVAANIVVGLAIYNCEGLVIPANDDHFQKIKLARSFFTKSPGILEPEYYIIITPCYNAWAVIKRNETKLIIISEPAINNFSPEELAGMLGHEFAHLIRWPENIPHWQIDVEGAKLTSKNILLKELDRMTEELDILYEKNKTLMFVFPIVLNHHWRLIGDLAERRYRVNELPE